MAYYIYTRDGENDVEWYSDADWAGDVNDRKSTSGYLFTIGGGAVSWRSKKQTSVALSTADILTKGLSQDQFKRLRDMAGVKEIRKQLPEK